MVTAGCLLFLLGGFVCVAVFPSGKNDVRKKLLQRLLGTAQSPVLKMMVPKQLAGAIIGKAASNIKAEGNKNRLQKGAFESSLP